MDTLSTTIPNFQPPKSFHPSTTAHTHRTLSPIRHHPHHPLSSSKSSLNLQKDNFTPLFSSSLPPHSPNRTTLPFPPRATAHGRAASGYAAALVDVSLSNGVVLQVEKDVRRLLKVLRNNEVEEFLKDGMVEEGQKGKVVMEIVKKGGFEGHLVRLVKMVVGKGKKVEIVKEVLEEFLRIFYQLAPTAAN